MVPYAENGRKITYAKNALSQSSLLTSPYSFLNSSSWLTSGYILQADKNDKGFKGLLGVQ